MKLTLISIIILVTFSLFFLSRSGIFYKIRIIQKEMGPLHFVYQDNVGPYQEAGPIQNEIYQYLKDNFQIATEKGIGIYYDNPKKVPKDQLRSKAGCIVDEPLIAKLADLPTNYKIMKIDKQKMIYSEFPFKNKMSIFIGIMKVYPKMQKYCEENEVMFRESIEIYDVPKQKIIYLMQLD
jgi:hypothetical protein